MIVHPSASEIEDTRSKTDEVLQPRADETTAFMKIVCNLDPGVVEREWRCEHMLRRGGYQIGYVPESKRGEAV